MEKEQNKRLFKKRSFKIEPVIGTLKEVFGFRRYILRGLKKAKGESQLMGVVYNLKKIQKLMGNKPIKKALAGS